MEYLFGETNNATYYHNADRIFIRQFVSAVDAHVSRLRVYSIVSGNVKAMVYADNSDSPGSLIAANDESTACIGGQWNYVTVPIFQAYSGEKYWVGAVCDTNQTIGRFGTSGVTEYRDVTYSTWEAPTTWPGGSASTYESCFAAYGALVSIDYGNNLPQRGDVWFFDDTDGGNIDIPNGIVTMTPYVESAVYTCWFGGNWEDDGSKSTEKKQWWGNEGEPIERQYRGKLQSVIHGSPLTSAALPKIEEAALADLKKGLPKSLLSSVAVSASILTPKRLDLRANILTKTGTPYTVNAEVGL